jgi:cytoskeletal protein RodZ
MKQHPRDRVELTAGIILLVVPVILTLLLLWVFTILSKQDVPQEAPPINNNRIYKTTAQYFQPVLSNDVSLEAVTLGEIELESLETATVI